MALRSLGSQDTDQPKTPTLRQYCAQKGGKIAQNHLVKIVFKPNKAPNYSLVTETGFRVSVLEDNPLHKIFTDSLPEWDMGNVPLYVKVVDGSKGKFEVLESDDERITWNEYSWGWKLEDLEKVKTRGKEKGTVTPII